MLVGRDAWLYYPDMFAKSCNGSYNFQQASRVPCCVWTYLKGTRFQIRNWGKSHPEKIARLPRFLGFPICVQMLLASGASRDAFSLEQKILQMVKHLQYMSVHVYVKPSKCLWPFKNNFYVFTNVYTYVMCRYLCDYVYIPVYMYTHTYLYMTHNAILYLISFDRQST